MFIRLGRFKNFKKENSVNLSQISLLNMWFVVRMQWVTLTFFMFCCGLYNWRLNWLYSSNVVNINTGRSLCLREKLKNHSTEVKIWQKLKLIIQLLEDFADNIKIQHSHTFTMWADLFPSYNTTFGTKFFPKVHYFDEHTNLHDRGNFLANRKLTGPPLWSKRLVLIQKNLHCWEPRAKNLKTQERKIHAKIATLLS